MPNIGPGELLVILLIALVVFGPRKLPELGKSLGAGLREFRKSTQGLKDELEGSFKEVPTTTGPVAVQTIQANSVAVSAVTPITVTPVAVTPTTLNPTTLNPADAVSLSKTS